MGQTIDICDELERKQRSNFLNRWAAAGMDGAELGVRAEVYDAFFESEAELAKRITHGSTRRHTYIKSNIVADGQDLKLFIPETTGLQHWITSVKAVSAEMGKPIQLALPIIVSEEIPQQGLFESTVTGNSDVAEICKEFHRAEEHALLNYLESPDGRRMMLVDANRPTGENGKDWARLLSYLQDRRTLG